MMAHTDDADVLSIPEVAVELGVSRTQVYRLIEAGHLHTIEASAPGSLATRRRIHRRELEAYLSTFTD
jgi:excisionase family DNA binding protein